jgi:hypothetical protein
MQEWLAFASIGGRVERASRSPNPQIWAIVLIMAFDAIPSLWHLVPYEAGTCIP